MDVSGSSANVFSPLPSITNYSTQEFNRWPRSGLQNFIRCPSWLYFIFIFLYLLIGLIIIALLPSRNYLNQRVSPTQRWLIGMLALTVGFIVAIFFMFWIIYQCRTCNDLESWLILIGGLLLPVMTALITFFFFNRISNMYKNG